MKFKVGDRVAMYGAIYTHTGWRDARGLRGTVIIVHSNDSIRVEVDKATFDVHPIQCRKLVKKEQRRIWMNVNPFDFEVVRINVPQIGGHGEISSTPQEGWLEFVEVKNLKKKMPNLP